MFVSFGVPCINKFVSLKCLKTSLLYYTLVNPLVSFARVAYDLLGAAGVVAASSLWPHPVEVLPPAAPPPRGGSLPLPALAAALGLAGHLSAAAELSVPGAARGRCCCRSGIR